MKIFYRVSFIFIAGVLLSACGQPAPLLAPTPVILTYTPVPTLTDVPTQTPAPIVTSIPSATPFPPTPTPFVDFLESAFSVQDVDSFDGHTMQKITGWDEGIHSFEWMDSNHLLLYPIVGQQPIAQNDNDRQFLISVNFPNLITSGKNALLSPIILQSFGRSKQNMPLYGSVPELFPVVINLNSGKTWFPSSEQITVWLDDKNRPKWSAELKVLVSTRKKEGDYFVVVHDADGNRIVAYDEEILGVSPSRTKLMLRNGTWIDLKSGKIIKFEWDTDENELFYQVIWSSDETRIYTCCYHFGDAKAGGSFSISANNILEGMYSEEDKKLGYGDSLYNHLGIWVLNDRYVLSQMHALWDNNPGFIPLFDPSTRTYRDLGKLVGLPVNDEERTRCTNTFVSPNRKYILASCYTESYLINLERLDFQTYSEWITTDMQWSADGDFAWVNGSLYSNIRGDEPTRILSVSNKDIKLLPSHFQSNQLWWHPLENTLAYISESNHKLTIVDAQTMSTQEIDLSIAFSRLVWHPSGNSIALLAQDRSLWVADYPAFENPEQIMSPIADVGIGNLTWSPDGNSLAFVNNGDVYIVDVNTNP